ncbi:hypothetical protein EDD27_7843 [Nonomuraea polychroma]|uniref:Uncharacterized protein n=1 Tax=Nonomuraea polychroma TaxID=46176 RepID=A0A438MHE2_9ACTN|nr:hypothetical protein EDD27_7843 [Nonomuraea polychroma]
MRAAPIAAGATERCLISAEPCTGSNIDGKSRSGLRLADGAIPMLPGTAAARSLRMSANRFEPTITSNRAGSRTSLAQSASMCSWSQRTSRWAAARSLTSSSQKGIVCTMPLAPSVFSDDHEVDGRTHRAVEALEEADRPPKP